MAIIPDLILSSGIIQAYKYKKFQGNYNNQPYLYTSLKLRISKNAKVAQVNASRLTYIYSLRSLNSPIDLVNIQMAAIPRTVCRARVNIM